MKHAVRRLLRSAQAQLQMSSLLEAQIAALRQQMAALDDTRRGTLAAVERAGVGGLAFYAAAMRRLLDVERRRTATAGNLRDLERRLLAAQGRGELLLRRAKSLAAEDERKVSERETGELLCGRKARGKLDMMK